MARGDTTSTYQKNSSEEFNPLQERPITFGHMTAANTSHVLGKANSVSKNDPLRCDVSRATHVLPDVEKLFWLTLFLSIL